jgi:3,4-dihydroxyphthalate decarboxylase
MVLLNTTRGAGMTRAGVGGGGMSGARRHGLVEHVLGHVSLRTGPTGCWCAAAGRGERAGVDHRARRLRGAAGRAAGRRRALDRANELPIHRVLLRRRPDLTAVVHAHPPAVVAYSLLDRRCCRVYGAYDNPRRRAGRRRGAVWPRAALIRTDALAEEWRPPSATGRCCCCAGTGWSASRAGRRRRRCRGGCCRRRGRTPGPHHARGAAGRRDPRAIDDADLAELPDLGAGFTVDTMWRHCCAA